jgi:hypothetical protein
VLEEKMNFYSILIFIGLCSLSMGFRNAEWRHWSPGQPWPERTVQAGTYREGGANSPMYVARRTHQASVVVGYAYQNGPFFFPWHGKELSYNDYELLVPSKNLKIKIFFSTILNF